jgi:hypothetical protein
MKEVVKCRCADEYYATVKSDVKTIGAQTADSMDF